jgi:hypothetical protein
MALFIYSENGETKELVSDEIAKSPTIEYEGSWK